MSVKERKKLNKGLQRVLDIMSDGEWWKMDEIAAQADMREGSVGSRIRELREPRHGGYTIERRHVGDRQYEFRLIVNKQD